ncbi:hypothetical protein RRG08_013718 [Elysia crispata]|uniref:Uncharacterized protein n=1 Tax=Elysia crispata TaxID=231223 RepID=A0AAE0Z8D1_9GAST|nr:hypothetical protein RRG08_013718 [Elysia crispata]
MSVVLEDKTVLVQVMERRSVGYSEKMNTLDSREENWYRQRQPASYRLPGYRLQATTLKLVRFRVFDSRVSNYGVFGNGRVGLLGLLVWQTMSRRLGRALNGAGPEIDADTGNLITARDATPSITLPLDLPAWPCVEINCLKRGRAVKMNEPWCVRIMHDQRTSGGWVGGVGCKDE